MNSRSRRLSPNRSVIDVGKLNAKSPRRTSKKAKSFDTKKVNDKSQKRTSKKAKSFETQNATKKVIDYEFVKNLNRVGSSNKEQQNLKYIIEWDQKFNPHYIEYYQSHMYWLLYLLRKYKDVERTKRMWSSRTMSKYRALKLPMLTLKFLQNVMTLNPQMNQDIPMLLTKLPQIETKRVHDEITGNVNLSKSGENGLIQRYFQLTRGFTVETACLKDIRFTNQKKIVAKIENDVIKRYKAKPNNGLKNVRHELLICYAIHLLDTPANSRPISTNPTDSDFVLLVYIDLINMLHGIEKVRDFIQTGIASPLFSKYNHSSLCRLLKLNTSFDTLKQLIDARSINITDKNKIKWKPGVERMGGMLLKTTAFQIKPICAYFIMAHTLLGVTWPNPILGEKLMQEKYHNSTLYEELKWGSYKQMGRNILKVKSLF
jgi:hypothetical protein